jgi:eukaryotic-like serine/threonine-protein kinase
LAGNEGKRVSAVVPSVGEPGPLSRLLQELADAPGEDLLAAWRDELKPGDRLDRFEIRREIGRGGFGVVYEAYDHELGRGVAIKTLRPGRARHDFASGWIKKEAEAVAKLSHPTIVTLHDVCNCASGPYLVMELLCGKTLAERIAEGPVPPAEALRMAEEMARGLAHAHQRGVLHRDLKPANVFLCDDGSVKLLDFGLAHLLGQEGTGNGGTPAFMAPELWNGESATPACDVFALGVVLHGMVTGKLPSPVVGERGVFAVAPLPRSPVSRALHGLLCSCLSSDATRRPANGLVVLRRVEEVRRALGRAREARRLRLAIGAIGIASLVTIALGLAWQRNEVSGASLPVIVADVENATGDPELDGLSGLLATSLEQSRRLAVVPRRRVLEIARAIGETGISRVDESRGREVGRRIGARALLLPAVHRSADAYTVDVRAIDPVSGRELFRASDEGPGKASLPGLVDRASVRARGALHESGDDVRSTQVQVGSSVTSSLGAYDQYFRGQQSLADGRDGEALAAFQRAVAIDPTFAMAHLSAAIVLEGSDPDGSRASIAEAVRHMDRAPARERLLIQAWNAALQFRTEEALPYLEEVRRRWPDDPDGWFLAGQWLARQRGDWARALPYLERAASLDPRRTPEVVRAQLLSGRMDEALRTATRFAEERPGAPSLVLLTLTRSHRGEAREAAEVARRALRAGAPLQEPILHALIRVGSLDEAEAAARTWSDPGREDVNRRDAYVSLAVVRAVQGRMTESLAVLDEAATALDDGYPSPYLLWARSFLLGGTRDSDGIYQAAKAQQRAGFLGATCASMLLADLGDTERAEELARGAERTPCARISRAVTAWHRGDRAAAITDLQAIDLGTDRYYLARALLDVGRQEEAASTFRSYYLRQTGWLPFFGWSYPRSLLLEAGARERMGQLEEARRLVDDLLVLWARADPDLPFLAEARSMRARLKAAAAK